MGQTVAIVDDTEVVLETLKDSFKMRFPDVNVDTFSEGTDFIKALKQGKTYDVVIMDGRLPDGFTGPQYTAEALAINPKTVVVGFSSDERTGKLFLDHGAKYFVPKMAPIEEIYRTFKEALGM